MADAISQIKVPVPPPDINEFHRLAAQWKGDTRFLSSTTQIAAHPVSGKFRQVWREKPRQTA